jgi:serine/threonine protein kinase
MILSCLSYRSFPVVRTSIRMASTIVSKSGHVYNQREVLQEREDPRLSIFRAEYVIQYHTWDFAQQSWFRSQDQSFVFKRVSKPFYDLSLRLAADFPQSRRLRIHVDSNENENILIYPYYQNTLLGLFKDDTNISDTARKMILRQTGEAIQELHSRAWIHNGTINGLA